MLIVVLFVDFAAGAVLSCVLLEAANIVRSICLAVAHLHHMNIAHRDLKVSNTVYMHVYVCNHTLPTIMRIWVYLATEASETLSGVTNRNRRYIYIYIFGT